MSLFSYVQSFFSACTSVVNFIVEHISTDHYSDIVTTSEYASPSNNSTRTFRSSISYREARPLAYRTPAVRHSSILRGKKENDSGYLVPDEIKEYLLHNEDRKEKCVLNNTVFNIGNTIMHIKQGRLNITEENYAKYIHILLWLEEVEEKKKFNYQKLYNVTISKSSGDSNIYTLDSPYVDDKISPFFVGSTFTITERNDTYAGRSKTEMTRIKAIKNTTLYFDLKRFSSYHLAAKRFDIEFKFSRFLFVKMHLSVDNVARYLKSLIFPREAAYGLAMTRPMLRCFNPNIESNYEQMQAVRCIVQGSSGKAPFILHGPPGTGKTVTIVEGILQLVKNDSRNRILVSAHSNTAIDNVAGVLLKYIRAFDKNLFLRVYSKSRECIPENLEAFSAFSPVDLLTLMSYRIILCTLTHSTSYDLNFITHIVIDEAGQASEPSCLLPMGKLKTSRKLILSGDDKQLGPVVISSEAKKLGFEISLMERLKRDCDLYSGNNESYMVMLKKNYRSDFDIIELPNQLFYGGKLSAMAKSDRLTKINILDNKSLCRGIVFHAVLSTERKDGENPSYYNVGEFEIVKKYINELSKTYHMKDEDIGIITPYCAQVALIKDWVNKKRLNIDVNTVDAFQGQERRVILISTVRGKGNRTDNVNLGFVSDIKRFNVALTRAKAKAIVIGNPLCLRTNEFWNKYIRRCKNIGTYYGVDDKHFEPAKIPEDLNVMMKNLRV